MNPSLHSWTCEGSVWCVLPCQSDLLCPLLPSITPAVQRHRDSLPCFSPLLLLVIPLFMTIVKHNEHISVWLCDLNKLHVDSKLLESGLKKTHFYGFWQQKNFFCGHCNRFWRWLNLWLENKTIYLEEILKDLCVQ